MQISKYTELKVNNLLCYSFEKQQLYTKLLELNKALKFTHSKASGNIQFLIQRKETYYTLMIPKENTLTETVSDSIIDFFYLDSAIKIRFEGSIAEYEIVEPEIRRCIDAQWISSNPNTCYCILQADDTFDFMVFDIYISSDTSISP